MSEWIEHRLGEVCSRLRSGSSITAKDIHESGSFPVFGGNGIRGYAAEANFFGECAIIGRQGAYCGNVRYFKGEARMSEHAIVACAGPSHHTRFLAYILSNMNLGSLSGQAAQPGLSVKVLAQQLVRMPSRQNQERIAEILGAYDDLIEVNRQRVAVLEEMARGLFEEWFVRFRFPGHETTPILDTPDGPLPEGWKHLPLPETAEITYGFPFKSKLFSTIPDGTRVVRIRDVLNGSTATWTTEQFDPRYAVRDGDILVGMDGIFHMAMWAGGYAALVQRVARLRPSYGHSKQWLFQSVYPKVKYFEATISGTTVAHLGASHLNSMKLIVAEDKIQQIADRNFNALDEMHLSIRLANVRLAASRDLLLPRLISGQLSVASAERELEKVA